MNHVRQAISRQVAAGVLPVRIITFFIALAILWLPWALLIYGLGALLGRSQVANALALTTLYSCFMCTAWLWGRWIHQLQRPFVAYGLILSRQFLEDALFALLFGFSLVASLYGVEVLLGWANFHPRILWAIVLEGLAVGVGIGLTEELLFRGWLLTELRTSLSHMGAIFWSSIIFALAHFIKPLPEVLQTSPQFLGLLMLGILLASGRYMNRLNHRRFNSLGLPIGLHAGLVWGYYIVDVADLVTPADQVPVWITGIHGNPLAGVFGVTILGLLIAAISFLKCRSE